MNIMTHRSDQGKVGDATIPSQCVHVQGDCCTSNQVIAYCREPYSKGQEELCDGNVR